MVVVIGYRRCACYVWPIFWYYGIEAGSCGRCGQRPDVEATKEEFDRQERM